MLMIKNEKPQEKYIRRERYVGEMQRSFYIDDIDEKKYQSFLSRWYPDCNFTKSY